MKRKTDFLVVGSGLAGLSFALKAAEKGRVTILTKAGAEQSNSDMAQGGIAAVLAEGDTFESHIEDTLIAGAGLCRAPVVQHVVESAPARIEDLFRWGVQFDQASSLREAPENRIPWDLTREGGHSARRILHVQDQTGHAIHSALLRRVAEHPNIELRENQFAVDLILNHDLDPFQPGPGRCLGAYVYDGETGEVQPLLAHETVLATGGAGKVFLYTSNWSGATGDGLAMAWRAGCRVANLEFTQFHPTCLFHPQARNYLISEAVRGEGGVLINEAGKDFTIAYHSKGSLAPRDIVARAIDSEMKKTGAPCVYLDITHKSAAFIKDRFPGIYERCLQFGIDMTETPIPVVPAAHYQCGGVLSDLHGNTDLLNLRVIGESAFTGLHGANRLASNSLLECLVAAHETAESLPALTQPLPDPGEIRRPRWLASQRANDDELILISHLWEEVRRLMWNYVGIVRSNERLERALLRLKYIRQEIESHFLNFELTTDLIELRNIALVAELIVRSARARKESRGIHFNLDYPHPGPFPRDTVLTPRRISTFSLTENKTETNP